LSPLVTAANASASWMPARMSTSSLTPLPTISSPLNSTGRRLKDSLLWSMIETVCPARSIMVASVAPTRPQPRITTFICRCGEKSCSLLSIPVFLFSIAGLFRSISKYCIITRDKLQEVFLVVEAYTLRTPVLDRHLAAWDTFVDRHPHGHLLQSRGW